MCKRLKSVLLLLLGGKIVGLVILFGLVNIMMLEVRDYFLALNTEFDNCTYPIVGVMPHSQLDAHDFLTEALSEISGDNNHVLWVLGRISLAKGDFESAAQAMTIVDIEYWDNPLFFQDAWVAFNLGAEFEDLVLLQKILASSSNLIHPYSTRLPITIEKRIISDTLSLSYLEIMGDESFTNVLQFRSNDAYVSYHLQKQSKQSKGSQNLSKTFPELSLDSFYSTDKRYLEYTLQVIPSLVDMGVLDIEVASRLLCFFTSYYEGVVDISDSLVELTKFSSSNPEISFCLAEYYRFRGELDISMEIYHQLYISDSQNSAIPLRLGMISEDKCDDAGVDFCKKELQEAIDRYQEYCFLESNDLFCGKKLADTYESLAAVENDSFMKETAAVLRTNWMKKAIELGPEVEVNYELDKNWLFWGYRCDEGSLSQGKSIPLWLYWKGSNDSYAGDESDGWYNFGGGLWIQIVEDAHNLIFDGGFDLSLLQGNAMAFPYDIYTSSSANREIVTEKFVDDKETAVALLNNTLDNKTSFTSYLIPVDVNALYLQTGWIKSEGGKAYIGRRWLGCTPRGQKLYNYVVFDATHSDWRHYAGLGEPLQGSKWAEVWLLNFKSSEAAYFDNVNFVKIGRPGQ